MRKSKAVSSSSSASCVESSSSTVNSGSSSSSSSAAAGVRAPVSSSSSKNKKSGSSSIGSRSTTTATTAINNTTTTTATTITGSNSGSSNNSKDGCTINGTRGSSSNNSNNNDNNSNDQSAGQKSKRPSLDRQFDVITDPLVRQFGTATAPLATFDTVDLSDEEVVTDEVTTSEDTLTTTTNTNSPSTANNVCTNKTTTTTTMSATAATNTAARTQEIKTTHSISDTTSCSNSSNVSAYSPRNSATNNTNSATITTTEQNNSPSITNGKKSGKDSGKKGDLFGALSSGLSSTTVVKTKSNKIGGKNSSPTTQADANTSSAKTNRTVESISVRSTPHPDGVKDSEVTFTQSRVTDPHAIHPSSSDEGEDTNAHVATADSAPASSAKHKFDSGSLDVAGPGSDAAAPAADTAAAIDGGATAASASLTAPVDFANFGSTEDLNTNNIGGNQSTTTADGGGSTAPAASGGGAAPKPKEVSTVEKASLLDESSSSDSDLSPTEPNPGGGAYTTLTSRSTPNLIRKISHDATSTIQESGGQPMDFNSPELMTSTSKRKAYERRLQRLQVKTTPINRPRSTTPLSVVTLDEYTNLSSPEISPNLEKLKIVLPADQFGRPIKSPRSKENAFDFNEDRLFRHTKEAIVLQSDGSIGQSPRRIFIPPTLSPSQSPCKAAAGSPVSKLVLVSRLPAGTSPLVKSAAPPPVISPPPSSTTTSFSCSSTSSTTTSSTATNPAPWQTSSDKLWEQFEDSRSKLPPQHQQPPQATTCAVPKRPTVAAAETAPAPVALPPTLEKKQGYLSRSGSSEKRGGSMKGHHRDRDQEKRKKKGSIGDDSKPTTFEQHTLDSRRKSNSTLNPSHQALRAAQINCPDEEEEIIKIEIGSSEVGKAYNIELEVTAKEKMVDPSHSKSSS